MTGEALPVEKTADNGNNQLYQGTTINTGKCMARITATGGHTALGKLGKAISTPDMPITLLQQQINRVVRKLAGAGLAGFLVLCVINLVKSHDLASSILLGLTLAMAAIPEEIPVAFSSFMALGAYHMSRKGIISRQPQIIEHLGAVSVVCLDKTGTLTENRMKVVTLYDHHSGELTELEDGQPIDSNLLYYAALASERLPFDSMEKAILEAYNTQEPLHAPLPEMTYEYALEGRPPMMTHIYPHFKGWLAAAKGAPERIIQVCRLNNTVAAKLAGHLRTLTGKGYRVLGIASAIQDKGLLPEKQDDLNWQFEGFLSLYDPPKQHASHVIDQLYNAGIQVKLLTGDYPATAQHIAAKTGFRNHTHCVTGQEIMAKSTSELDRTINREEVFARMFPEAKLKVINALNKNGEITAMTGDGVNDGLALKAAHIGIAMGKQGTEIARMAADLVITDDNLEKIPEAIQQGRKIYNNLKKAVRYIISIHIPIILTAIIPLLMGWRYPVIFTPIHIIFLELIMGPTCSIFFEREPVESGIMTAGARRETNSLFGTDELLITLVQGLIIAAGALGIYYIYMQQSSPEGTRTVVFTTLIISNIFLTFTNRSFTENIARTIRYKNNLAPVVILVSVLFLLGIHLIPGIRELFQLSAIGLPAFLACAATGIISVGWFELYKAA